MASLQATTCTTLEANVVTSPLTLISTSYSMEEYSGSVVLANNASADIIGHSSYGYVWQVGTVQFMGVMSSMSWTFGIFDYAVSLYGATSNNQIVSDWGSYSVSQYSTGTYDNRLRFTNTSGSSGTFYFTVLCSSFTSNFSNTLIRIK